MDQKIRGVLTYCHCSEPGWLLISLEVADAVVLKPASIFQNNHCYLNVFWVLVSWASVWFTTFHSVFYLRSPHLLVAEAEALQLQYLVSSGALYNNFAILRQLWLKVLQSFPRKQLHFLPHLQMAPSFCISVYCRKLVVFHGILFVRHHRKMNVHTAGRIAVAKAHITALKLLSCFLI